MGMGTLLFGLKQALSILILALERTRLIVIAGGTSSRWRSALTISSYGVAVALAQKIGTSFP